MIRLLLWLGLIAALGAGAAWVADHPGHVTMHWSGYRIDTSIAFLIAIFALGIFIFAYLYILARALVLMPVNFSRRRQVSCYQQGLSELTYSVAALAASDIKNAQSHTQKAEKLLGQTPLTLLLSAQIARLQGDDTKTQALLTKMLEHKETEYLAAQSLSEAASRQELFSKAVPLAERARKVNPRDKHPALQLIALHLKLEEWQQATQAITAAYRSGALLRSEKKRYLGLAALQQGRKALDAAQLDTASACAKIALSYLPEFVPSIQLSARTSIALGKGEQAIKLIFSHWKSAAHPELAAILRLAMAKEPEARQLKLAEKLVSLLPEHPESQLALAETAIKHKAWAKARQALRAALSKQESMRACKLMAYVEQGEFADSSAAGRWLTRSSEAQPDAAWSCDRCGDRTDSWHTHCSHCGAFDSYVWKDQSPLVYQAA
ncbi:MAG: hypothetical protein LW823_07455 [Rickettsiales bacterium]|jgi:HemY protein|nr:hypothetical protein [Rickettsiales bacterium]